MKLKVTVKSGRKMFDIPERMCEKLLEKGEKALGECYPNPGKGYAVAVLTSKGNIYTGASYSSNTETLTMHSEAVALVHAAQHGETEIVAITGPNCHICKQLIWESSLHSRIEVLVVVKENGKVKQIPISDLMPYPWPDAEGNG